MIGLIGRKVEFIYGTLEIPITGIILDKVLRCNIVGIPVDYYIIQECDPREQLRIVEPSNIKKVVKR